ncbi:MAG: ATPase [marine bacterium B5-7]|nr:MAG: ATPase [marine bacterium B5-7]
MLKRNAQTYLTDWLADDDRKPLVIRGARQVGKTTLVRQLAVEKNLQLIELNLEKNPEHASFFEGNNPKQTLQFIQSIYPETIEIKRCILFLDEIQAAPTLLAKLRWFAEDMPALAVIAAGSLLEFVLANHTFSMPVGRITYLHLEPLTFEEFLQAKGKESLRHLLNHYTWQQKIPEAIHIECIRLFKEYMFIGGMPAAVLSWVNTEDLNKVAQKHQNLLSTYQDDFSKYNGRLAIERLHDVMNAVPAKLGEKFVLSHVNPDVQHTSIKTALDLLSQARLCHKVMMTSGNGVPLSAEENAKFYKVIYLDIGLMSAMLGLQLNHIASLNHIELVNRGGLAEQVVGQSLRSQFPFYMEPKLHYWTRLKTGADAELDYLIQHAGRVIPIEVKAGSTGSMKSLHLFMAKKQLKNAVRINADYPSITDLEVKTQNGMQAQYTLYSLPFYLMGQLQRLLDAAARS